MLNTNFQERWNNRIPTSLTFFLDHPIKTFFDFWTVSAMLSPWSMQILQTEIITYFHQKHFPFFISLDSRMRINVMKSHPDCRFQLLFQSVMVTVWCWWWCWWRNETQFKLILKYKYPFVEFAAPVPYYRQQGRLVNWLVGCLVAINNLLQITGIYRWAITMRGFNFYIPDRCTCFNNR